MGTLATASKNVIKWAIAAFAVAFAVAAAGCLAEPAKAYADTGSHVEATSEIHVLVDGAGNVTIPNVTLKNTGSVAAYITGCAAPDELSGWTCDAAGKRIDAGSSITCTWSSNGPVSDAVASKLGEEEYFAGNLTYAYVDAALTGTVTLDNNDPYIGDTVTATVSGLNVSDDKVSYQWVKAKDGQETDIPAANGLAYTVADDDAGYTLICKLISSDSICQGSISSDATHAVKRVEAFAVYSADDNSLNFYKRSSVPAAGSSFEGKTATAVYTGIESTAFRLSEQYWKDHVNDIKSAAVIDDGLQPTNLQCWFQSCENMVSCDLSKLDSSKVTDLSYMFYYCTSLTSISGVNELDTANVINMMDMFDSCTKLTTLDLSGWKTSKVGAFWNMFNNCSSLTTVGNLSGWDTSNASEFRYMFARCSSLKALDGISNWNTSNAKSSTNWFGAFGGMFYNCKSITSLDLSNWDNSNTQPTSLGDGYGKCDMFTGMTHLQQITVGSKWKWMKSDVESWLLPKQTSANIDGADGTWYDANGNAYDASEIPSNTAGTYYASRPKTAFVTNHSDFNTGASGVTLPKTWQTSANSDAGNASAVVLSDEDSPADSLSGPQNDSGGSEASSDADVASKEEDAANDAVSDEAASQTGDLPAAA